MGTLGAGRGAGSGGQRSWQRLVGLVQHPICSQFELSEGLPTAREPVVHSFAAHVLTGSGRKPANGLEARPPGRSTRCRAVRSRVARFRVALRGSPRGFTN